MKHVIPEVLFWIQINPPPPQATIHAYKLKLLGNFHSINVQVFCVICLLILLSRHQGHKL